MLADPPMVLLLKVTNGDKPGATAHSKFITCKKIKQQQNYKSCETVLPIHRVHVLPASKSLNKKNLAVEHLILNFNDCI